MWQELRAQKAAENRRRTEMVRKQREDARAKKEAEQRQREARQQEEHRRRIAAEKKKVRPWLNVLGGSANCPSRCRSPATGRSGWSRESQSPGSGTFQPWSLSAPRYRRVIHTHVRSTSLRVTIELEPRKQSPQAAKFRKAQLSNPTPINVVEPTYDRWWPSERADHAAHEHRHAGPQEVKDRPGPLQEMAFCRRLGERLCHLDDPPPCVSSSRGRVRHWQGTRMRWRDACIPTISTFNV